MGTTSDGKYLREAQQEVKNGNAARSAKDFSDYREHQAYMAQRRLAEQQQAEAKARSQPKKK